MQIFTLTANTMAAPPNAHVKSAFLEVTQGKTIYANGKMQAVVDIFVELLPNVNWNHKVTFFELTTGKKITDMGWTVSNIDNGYDHNIGTQQSLNISTHDEEKISRFNNTTRYISTKQNNEKITICFEIETRKTSNLKYSTCDQLESDMGTGSIFAKRPETYVTSDFEVTKRKGFRVLAGKNSTGETYDLTATIFGFRPRSYIPRHMKFTMVNYEDIIVIDNKERTRIDQNSDDAAARWYDIRDKIYLVNYKESYFFKVTGDSTDTNMKSFRFYSIKLDNSPSYQYQLVYADGSDTIINVLALWVRRNSFIYKNERCEQSLTKDYFQCYYYDKLSQTVKEKIEPKTIESDLKSNTTYNIDLENNYGTPYSIVWEAIEPFPKSK